MDVAFVTVANEPGPSRVAELPVSSSLHVRDLPARSVRFRPFGGERRSVDKEQATDMNFGHRTGLGSRSSDWGYMSPFLAFGAMVVEQRDEPCTHLRVSIERLVLWLQGETDSRGPDTNL